MRKLLRSIVHNLDLKVVALGLGVLTWHYLATSGLEQRRYRKVGLRILNLSPDAAILSQEARHVTVVLNGPRGQLDALEGERLVAEIDLRRVKLEKTEPLKTSITLAASNIRVAGGAGRSKPLPAGITFLRAEPLTITFTLNSLKEQELPVKVQLDGNPAPGFALHYSVQPQRVLARGPFELFRTLTEIATEKITVDGLSKGFERTVALRQKVEVKKYGAIDIVLVPRTVEVSVSVTEKPEEKTIEHVPIRLAAVPKDLAVIRQEGQPRDVTVKLRGPRRLLDEIDARTLAVEANLEDVTPPEAGTKPYSFFFLRKHVRQVAEPGSSLPLPQGVELVEVEPKTVQLILDRLRSRLLPVEPVLEGRPAEDHEVKAVALPEKVEVHGPQSIVAQMKTIATEPVIVTGLTERLRRPVRLVRTADAGQFRNVPIEPAQPLVDVIVSVTERRVRKTLNGLPVRLLVTPRAGLAISVEMDPKTLGPVVFEGPRSRIERLAADSVAAFVRLEITTVADLRPTIRNVEFHIADPQIRLAPDSKPIAVKLDFPPAEPEPEPKKPTRKTPAPRPASPKPPD
jgi:hypothetical protein